MKRKSSENERDGNGGACRRTITVAVAFCVLNLLFLSACAELEKPAAEPFFAQTNPPKKQEFRWSNGRLPKSLDPAIASAPPETDVVRAVYEGLTETDPRTLDEVSGVAESWSATDAYKVWRFTLRKNARWTNGKPVTAEDFVRSWKRLIAMGKKAAHSNLLDNIVGVPPDGGAVQVSSTAAADLLLNSSPTPGLPVLPVQQLSRPVNANVNSVPSVRPSSSNPETRKSDEPEGETFGIVAQGENVLKVTLVAPDRDFPKLVANPIFRPIYGDGEEFEGKDLKAPVITNGPFKIASVDSSGIVLDRSENYWNRDRVKLERVHFVAMENAEKA
ncbi:MAG: ABC transporter substrate-binding protein, partial [Pyrinomonadaceae bacterium]